MRETISHKRNERQFMYGRRIMYSITPLTGPQTSPAPPTQSYFPFPRASSTENNKTCRNYSAFLFWILGRGVGVVMEFWRSESSFIKMFSSNKSVKDKHLNFFYFIITSRSFLKRRYISVDIAMRYGPDDPWIESRWGRDFPHPSWPALGPT
jgi:hypothetical protein